MPEVDATSKHTRITVARKRVSLRMTLCVRRGLPQPPNRAPGGAERTTVLRRAQALRYLEKQYTREAETYMEETEHRALQKRHSVPLLLNLAAVQLKLGDYRAAIASCDEVHRWENMHRLATAAEVWNAKMLYRRGSECHFTHTASQTTGGDAHPGYRFTHISRVCVRERQRARERERETTCVCF
jgi:hypothetical protein